MEEAVARKILEAAREGGYLDQEIPDKLTDLLSLGEYYFDEAKKAEATGMNDEAITRIVEIGNGAKSEAPPEPEPEPAPDPEVLPDGLESAYVGVDEMSETDIRRMEQDKEDPVEGGAGRQQVDRQEEVGTEEVPRDRVDGIENLPVPGEIEGDISEMPRDLTKLNDREVRRLHGEYNAALARATWLVAIATSDLSNAEHLYDAEVRRATGEIRDRLEGAGTKATRNDIDNEALMDREVGRRASEMRTKSSDLAKLKALREIYKGNVDRLSREWTMRGEEFERSGGKR